MPDIFLSYSREDQVTARRFAEGFERAGFTVWWDATLRSGEEYDQVTEDALRGAAAVIVLWSARSVTSRWVRTEAAVAQQNKTLMPVMIEPCQRPIMFELTHTADLSAWKGGDNDPAWLALVTDVRRLIDRGGQGRPRAADSVAPPNKTPDVTRRFRWRWAAMASLGLLVLLGGGFAYLQLQHAGTPAQGGARAPAAAVGVSLAVLPFADMSPEHDQEYFSDGLSEELLNQLAQIRDLQVAGRTSSFSFKGKSEDLRIIGEKLGVNHLLEGSVRKSGPQLRITAQLINAASGIHEWSQTYDRKLEDVFAVQEEIAKDVANALSVRLGVGGAREVSVGTSSVEAYEKYLRARALIARGGPDHQRGVDQYREAVALDPTFARAWSELYSALQISIFFFPKNQDELRREMATASERTLALAPDAWWTQAMRARQLRSQHRWSEAEAAAKLAMSSAPASEIDAIQAYASFLDDVGRVKESIPYFRRMRDADPLSLRVSGFLQIGLRSAGHATEAQTEYERSRDLDGTHSEWDWYALLRQWQRKDADLAEVAGLIHGQAALEPSAVYKSLLLQLEDKLNDPAGALALLRKAYRDPAIYENWGNVTGIVELADHFGDRDLALAAFRRRLELTDIHYIAWWPYETGLRSDPRFKQIVRDLKLDSYWRTSGNWGDFCKPVGKDDFECH